jgi:Secretion system C-terminal sorting domain
MKSNTTSLPQGPGAPVAVGWSGALRACAGTYLSGAALALGLLFGDPERCMGQQIQPAPGVEWREESWTHEKPGYGERYVLESITPDPFNRPIYVTEPYGNTPTTWDESGEAWWYAHENVYDANGTLIAYFAGGYTHMLNWGVGSIPGSNGIKDPTACVYDGHAPNDPDWDHAAGSEGLADLSHRQSSPFGTIALLDLQGKVIWHRITMLGSIYSVSQDLDGNLVAIGDAGGNRTAYAPMTSNPVLYNGLSSLDLSQVTCGVADFETDSWLGKMGVFKYNLQGDLLWSNAYGKPASTLATAWDQSARGQDIIPIDVEGGHGYLAVGNTRLLSDPTRDGGFAMVIRADGTVADYRLYDPNDFALSNGAGSFMRFFAADRKVISGVQHILMTGDNFNNTPHGQAVLFKSQLDGQGHLTAPDWQVCTKGSAFSANHDANKEQFCSGGKFIADGPSSAIIWPVLSNYNGPTYSGPKDAELKIYRLDMAGNVAWGGPVSLGEVRAFDLQAEVCQTTDHGIAVVSTRWSKGYDRQHPFSNNNLTPDQLSCLTTTFGFDQVFDNTVDIRDWNTPLDGYNYWNTDAYVNKLRLSDGAWLWSTTFDAEPDEAPECTPGDLKKQECLYKITEAQDGGLVISGNTSYNQDWNYLAKIYSDCQSQLEYDPTVTAGLDADNRYTVGTNESWNASKNVHGTIVIPNHHKLTITNNAVIAFADSRLLDHPTRIVVEAGGQLSVQSGATLTSLPGCNTERALWDGIIVQGDDGYPLQQPLTASRQGYASLRVCRIENARVAISVGEDLLATNSMAVAQGLSSGGIVIADNATFRNNVRDVVFSPFENYHGDYPNGLYGVESNFSRFRKCTFENTATLNDPYQRPESHATLFGVRGVRFQGCTFTGGVYPMLDEYDNTVLTDQYMGQGIKSLNSTFAVEAQCATIQPFGTPCPEADLLRNTFTTLWYGVNASTFGDMSRTFIVDRADFAGCVKGIRMEGIQDPGITLNTFEVGDLPVGDLAVTPYGVYSDQCTGYEIEENRFGIGAHSETGKKVGLIIKDSGKNANTFYNNTFDALHVGSLIEGNNASNDEAVGLEVKCNDYGLEAKCDFDVALTGDAVKVQSTQGSSSGEPDAPAGNRFSLEHDGSFDVEEDWFVEDNFSTVSEYFHHTPTPGNRTLPTYRDLLNLFATDQQSFWPDKETACPSNLDREKSRSEKRSASLTEDEEYNDGKDAYDAAKDDGDTYSLASYVNDPTKSSTQVRNALQSVAPKVSAEVWQAAFERSPALSVWHITQALISNSPLQGEVLKLMSESGLPAFYTNLVVSAQNGEANILSLLESAMAYHAGQKAEALQGLGRESFLDSLDLDGGLDSLKLWHEGLLADNHGLAVGAVLAAKGDMAALYDLAHSYELAGDDPNLYGLVKRYTAGWAQADEATRTWVSDLSTQRSVMGSAQANAWREALGEASVEEIILLPLEIRAAITVPRELRQPVQWADEVVLEAYPNPTKGPVYIIYQTPVENVQFDLRVVDANGREVYRSTTQAGAGIVELSTTEWSSGLYVVELSSRLSETARVKLSVQR